MICIFFQVSLVFDDFKNYDILYEIIYIYFYFVLFLYYIYILVQHELTFEGILPIRNFTNLGNNNKRKKNNK